MRYISAILIILSAAICYFAFGNKSYIAYSFGAAIVFCIYAMWEYRKSVWFWGFSIAIIIIHLIVISYWKFGPPKFTILFLAIAISVDAFINYWILFLAMKLLKVVPITEIKKSTEEIK